MSSFRFHVLALPHTITSPEYCMCAFTNKVLKFCAMMTRRGHIVYHYGHEDSKVECYEHISIITNALLKETYGDFNRNAMFKYSCTDKAYVIFNQKAIEEVGKRKQLGDFLLVFWEQKEVARAHIDKCIPVRPGIGSHLHNTTWCPFTVWESYCVMNNSIGFNMPKWSDCVIPNFFDVSQFEYKVEKQNYLLFMARIIINKGILIAIELAQKTNSILYIAGQGDYEKIIGSKPPSYVHVLGCVDEIKRKELLANAKALIMPTCYSEPFGGVVIEAGLSGTPVITSDFGAFPEIVLHGKTGYRCRTMDHFIYAVKNIHKIKPQTCRSWTVKNFSMSRIALKYEEYFQMVTNSSRKAGFYQENNERNELDWLENYYPS